MIHGTNALVRECHVDAYQVALCMSRSTLEGPHIQQRMVAYVETNYRFLLMVTSYQKRMFHGNLFHHGENDVIWQQKA